MGDQAAAMVDGYFALGEEAALQRLCTTAGIAHARVPTREGWARFASIDELIRIEIKGSPLASLVDETRYQNVLKSAHRELRDFSDAQAGGRRLSRPPSITMPFVAAIRREKDRRSS